MGYYNTVYQYGMDSFIVKCRDCGIDGVIIPDLPPDVYEREYQKAFEGAGLHFICLVAPQTPPDRAHYLASLSRGFLYRLSSSSTTGSVREGPGALPGALPGLSDIPTLIGFGIHDRTTFEQACTRAKGAIIGTAFIKHLQENIQENTEEPSEKKLKRLCREFIGLIRNQPVCPAP